MLKLIWWAVLLGLLIAMLDLLTGVGPNIPIGRP